ncbi:outer membrane protein assembly factor BamD [Helicobacter pylori]
MKKIVAASIVMAILSACATPNATVSKDAQMSKDWSNDHLYSEARNALNSGNYSHANALYGVLRARQPDGRYTEQSLLDSAYAHYKNEEMPQALALLSRFERNYPASVDMDYALYLKGLIFFAEDQSFLRKLASQDWSDRDPEANRRAFRVFEQLVNRFPQSKYAEDSRRRMAQLVDALGGHEIAIARYYAKRHAYVAANNRAQRVLQQYQNTRYVEEALAIMIFSYEKMGNTQLADDTRRVLQQNFANSPYLTKPWQPDDIPWWRWWK